MKKILVVSRPVIEGGLYMMGPDGEIKDIPPHMVISITDPDKRCANVNMDGNIKALLRLQFWDINTIEAFEHDTRYEEFKKSLFDEGHAKRIVAFVRKHMNKADLIICQCEAGQSRSAGVAGALAKAINGDDSMFFRPPYRPNSRVYSRVLREWKTTEPKEEPEKPAESTEKPVDKQ